MNSAHLGRVIAAGTIGNVLEWYDFAIYGYFAAPIGRQFFPQEDAVAQLLSAFGVFAVGYLMRPVGGVLVGHIGDTDVKAGICLAQRTTCPSTRAHGEDQHETQQ
jgi:MHS family proline/betaine transporter-like MFS transporter